MDLNNTPQKMLSKSPMIKRNSNNDAIMKRNEDTKNHRTVSPIKGRGSIVNKYAMTVKQNNRDNKFNYNTEFREINTSPLLIRVYIIL